MPQNALTDKTIDKTIALLDERFHALIAKAYSLAQDIDAQQ